MTNRDLNLMVGVGLQLEKNDSGVRYFVELLGYRVGEGVIISAPLEHDGRLPLMPGDEVTVRYLGGMSQYAFKTQVIHISTAPYLHVHLEYPGGIEATMTRRAVRMPVRESVIRLAMDDDGHKLSVEMKNISFTGASLVASVKLGGLGERFSIDMPTLSPDNKKAVTLPCMVRHISAQRNGESSIFHHGVEFIDVDSLARDFIGRYIEHRSAG
ncbi:MAG: flagellar brake protein [Gammaproteobacteria bacterium]|nr:flagellar brake protein [Gammaproteobacteria bacterium]